MKQDPTHASKEVELELKTTSVSIPSERLLLSSFGARDLGRGGRIEFLFLTTPILAPIQYSCTKGVELDLERK